MSGGRLSKNGGKWLRDSTRWNKIVSCVEYMGAAQCAYCDTPIDFSAERSYSIDHIVSHERGGTNAWNNLVLVCWTCNCVKSDKSLDQWRINNSIDEVFATAQYRTARKYTSNSESRQYVISLANIARTIAA